jgi:hypothetical protein
MIEGMTVRNFLEKTQKDYTRHVKNLTAFLGRSPDRATAEDLRLYQLHLTDTGVRPPTINSAISAGVLVPRRAPGNSSCPQRRDRLRPRADEPICPKMTRHGPKVSSASVA